MATACSMSPADRVVASRVSLVSRKFCYVTGLDINEGMLNAARSNPQVEWRQGSATELPSMRIASIWYCASKDCNIFPTAPRPCGK
jgi:hypothetical protein